MRVMSIFLLLAISRKNRRIETAIKFSHRSIHALKRMQDTILLPHINSTRSKFTTNIYLFRRASSLVIDRVLAFVFERRSKKDKRMASKKGRYGKARPKSLSLVRSVLTRVARLLHAICDQSLSTLFLHRRIEIDRYSALWKGTEFV